MEADRLSTKEDIEKFVRWLADPKFRQLFETFVKTATDSDEKLKFEADSRRIRKHDEIVRLDFNNPADHTSGEKQIPLKVDPTTQQVYIRPERGFCLATRTRIYKDYKFDKELPLIINICHHKAVESAQLIHRHTNCGHDHASVPEDHEHDGNDDVYKVPFSLGPAIKLPYKGEVARVYDCVFSSKTYQEFKNDDRKRAVLIETALKAVKEQYSENPVKEYCVLPDMDYFEDKSGGDTKKQDIIPYATPAIASRTESFKRTPIKTCQTPLMNSADRATIIKSIIDHLQGDNQFYVLIAAHGVNIPPTIIRQQDDFIQIRVDGVTISEVPPIIQLNASTLEIRAQKNPSSDGAYQLELDFSYPADEHGSYWTSTGDCLVINLKKPQPTLWNRILNL